MLSAVLFVLGLVAHARAHGALMQLEAFHPKGGLDASMAFPLNSGSGDTAHWFFRGLKPSDGTGSIKLKAGGSVDLKIGCDPSAPQNGQFCDDGGGSLHSSNGKRTGCGLAISYKEFSSIKPEDLIVFSTLNDCIHPSTTHTFKIPSNLPATKNGKPATCAFGWIPAADSAADEMYMTGFNCEVSGGSAAGSAISNAKELPFQYFAVSGFGSSGGNRPSWSGAFKSEGAQKLVVSGSSSSDGASTSSKSSSKSSSGSSNSTGVDASSKSGKSSSKGSSGSSNSTVSASVKAKKCKAKNLRSRRAAVEPVRIARAVVEPAQLAPIVTRDTLKRHPHLGARRARPLR